MITPPERPLSPFVVGHIQELIEKHRLFVSYHDRDPSEGRAWPKERFILIPVINSWTAYAVALHEIGHILTYKKGFSNLELESLAWEWAADNARQWDNDMTKIRSRALRSHMKVSKAKGLTRGLNAIETTVQLY